MLPVRLPIIACLLEALSSATEVSSFKHSTLPAPGPCSSTLFPALSPHSSSDLDNMALMLLNTWHLWRNTWSDGRNFRHQQRTAICYKCIDERIALFIKVIFHINNGIVPVEFYECSRLGVMVHLHWRRRTRKQIPNQMATLYYAELFTMHRIGLGSLLPISA